MREIKFRAWNPDENEMLDAEQIEQWRLYDLNLDDEFSLMQFTGLKDKNGKEIYEGDIVTYGGYTEPVEYKDSYFAMFEDEPLDPGTMSDEAEVLGNIYENPELAK